MLMATLLRVTYYDDVLLLWDLASLSNLLHELFNGRQERALTREITLILLCVVQQSSNTN